MENRRQFLGKTARAALAGGALLAGPLPRSSAAGANDRIRIAVVGVRGRGQSHARAYAAMKDVEVAALCDPDRNVVPAVAKRVEELQGKRAEVLQDFRKVLDDPTIHAISIATPDHWHALATILGCQAGKDVYVEKPCSHNIREGRLMVEAARKYGRVVQHGTQSRSGETFHTALELIRSGKLGKIRLAKAINSQLRDDIGRKQDGEVPEGVDYDLWLGPAPKRAFNPNRFHYNWHWFWDYGTGDLGNDGVHPVDYARWMLGVEDPIAVSSSGSKLFFEDDQETPDTQTVVFEFEGCHLIFEQRIWTPYREHGLENGAVLYGDNGCMELSPQGWKVTWKGDEAGPTGKPSQRSESHFRDFIDCMRTRKAPRADILEGHLSTRLCHMGNIATRVGRRLRFDAKTETFIGDEEADRLLWREPRTGFRIPDPV